jgi:hypothetical protein
MNFLKYAAHGSVARRRLCGAGAVAFLMIAGSADIFATPLGVNLIDNPGAELGASAANYTSIVAPSGKWVTTGNFSAVQYAAGASVDLNTDDSRAIGGGNSFFAGGPNNALSTASQNISFADLASSVDTGMISFVLSGYLGGWSVQLDNMRVGATFLNAANATLLTSLIGPVSNGDRGNVSELLYREIGGIVPVGARSVTIVMTSTWFETGYNDGYADNLSLQLQEIVPSAVPEPTSIALLGLGLVGMTARFARRRYRKP